MKSTAELYNEITIGFYALEPYFWEMAEDEKDATYYVADFLGAYIDNVLNLRGSLAFILSNGIEQIKEKLEFYDGILKAMQLKFGKRG